MHPATRFTPTAPPAGLPGVVTRLATELRREGLVLDAEQVADLHRALARTDLLSARRVHAVCLPICCRTATDRDRFARAFHRTFSAHPAASAEHTDPVPTPGTAGSPEPGDLTDAAATADDAERLGHRELPAIDLDALAAWLAATAPRRARRRRRRWRATRRGRIDPGRTLRMWSGTEADRLRFAHRRRRRRRHRLVLVVDVSGSMRRWAPAYLLAAQALATQRPAPATRAPTTRAPTTRIVTLATRSTDVTAALTDPDPVAARRALHEAVPDLHGGTRLGRGLADLVDASRGAVVVVFSDGWEHGDTAPLADAAARLARRARSLHWVAPAAGRADYHPRTAGMRAVLPHLTALHPGTTPEDLDDLLTLLGDDRA